MNTPFLSVRVARKAVAAQDICVFELVAADGAALPPFTAGAHIDVQLPGGLTRQYSLCNPPHETQRYQIGVLRDAASRGGSLAMHEQIQAGQQLTISAPKNHFPLVAGAGRSLLLAGGIGVTPILCMAEALGAAGADFEMHYCTRSRTHAAFLDRLAAAPFASQVSLHFDDEAPAQRLDIAALLASVSADTHLYVCGPKGFIEAVLASARAQGWAEARLHCEFFAGEVINVDTDAAFEVELKRSGRVVTVPKGITIVKALGDAGIDVMVSCEQGVCGTCLTPVLEGQPDHRDSYLTPEEQAANDQMLLCCSRAKSARLLLDL
ncbi:PDR/VanB family oxidoreductase [Aquabacterium sp.]|uniref:PDR/VanB family oxidoreductase n=1 Tax=Aquabacterium sp. TaxID=1872578 RepID=UPI002CF3A266|nr:PDR/VanB family oxidoreductase [Aquabacterium sp.]HSW08457.1 PDR/VanB family oxidoreductase [Aquabacterium sp.]